MAVKKLDVRGAKCPIPIVRAKTAQHVLLRVQRKARDASGRELFIHVVERTG